VTNETEKNRRFEDMGRRLDEEVEKMIAYLNDEVVPQVRNHSSRALRIAAEKLSRFADYMDQSQAGVRGGTVTEHEHKEGSGI